MSKRRSTNYPPEQKASAIQLALQSDKPLAQIAKDLNIPSNTLYTWIKQAKSDGPTSEEKAKQDKLHQQLKELQKENKRLKTERDILKKAAAYFARED